MQSMIERNKKYLCKAAKNLYFKIERILKQKKKEYYKDDSLEI